MERILENLKHPGTEHRCKFLDLPTIAGRISESGRICENPWRWVGGWRPGGGSLGWEGGGQVT